ncbi:MAG: ketol-acid reductoisomerase [Enterobacterales bacterium]
MNYFNKLNFNQKLKQLKKCRFMQKNEFINSLNYLKNKKIVIIGCGSQGLNQGLNMRDSGLNISYALRDSTIQKKGLSWQNAKKNGFNIGTLKDMIPHGDLIINLTPDKEHQEVIQFIQPLMKYNAILGYSHGFHIVEIGVKIRSDITVIMVAPKCPGTEVRKEYNRNFGVPSLIAVHDSNDPNKIGLDIAKAWAFAIGSHKVGVLESSFIAEVKSDLMGEQTVLCGMLQVGSILCFDYLVENGFDAGYSGKLIQYGWEIITESLKIGGITLMMDRLTNSAKLRAFDLSEKLKILLKPTFEFHMNEIITGNFSKNMILDWHNNDINLLTWREKTNKSGFEKAPIYKDKINNQSYFDKGTLMIAIIKASVELSFDTMLQFGIKPESAYYESLHELPLIANTIARKKLYEMNRIISDTAEYGNYLFSNTVIPLLKDKFIKYLNIQDLGRSISNINIDNIKLEYINNKIRKHPIELVGSYLRKYMRNIY